jgi:hypothetical protein
VAFVKILSPDLGTGLRKKNTKMSSEPSLEPGPFRALSSQDSDFRIPTPESAPCNVVSLCDVVNSIRIINIFMVSVYRGYFAEHMHVV